MEKSIEYKFTSEKLIKDENMIIGHCLFALRYRI